MKIDLNQDGSDIVRKINTESSFGEAMDRFNIAVRHWNSTNETISTEKEPHIKALADIDYKAEMDKQPVLTACTEIDDKWKDELTAAKDDMDGLQAEMYQAKSSEENAPLFAALEVERGRTIMNRAFKIPEMDNLLHYLLFTNETHGGAAKVMYRYFVTDQNGTKQSMQLENLFMSLEELNEMLNEESEEITADEWLARFSKIIRDTTVQLESATLPESDEA